MLTNNIKVDFWAVFSSNFRKNFLPVDSSGYEVSESSGGKKIFDLRKKSWWSLTITIIQPLWKKSWVLSFEKANRIFESISHEGVVELI